MNGFDFNEITQNCIQKIIQQYSKKLEKNCSFKSSKDIANLRDLTFLLYIYGYNDYVNKCIEITHNNQKEIKPNDNLVLDIVEKIWGLEIKLLKEKGKNKKADEIISAIDQNDTTSFKAKRRKRFVIENRDGTIDITNANDIKYWLDENKISNANKSRLLALSDLIGLTETGLYPNLNKEKDKIKILVNEYKDEIIKTSK